MGELIRMMISEVYGSMDKNRAIREHKIYPSLFIAMLEVSMRHAAGVVNNYTNLKEYRITLTGGSLRQVANIVSKC